MVAAGAGHRYGGRKQFEELAGRPVVAWSLAAARSVADGTVLVVPPGTGDHRGLPADEEADVVVPGGATRAASVRAGLAAVPEGAAIVVVHDAVRPLAPPSLFEAVVAPVRSGAARGVVPVVPVADTLKRVEEGVVRSTVDREGLVAVQTPQAFDAATLRAAHRGRGRGDRRRGPPRGDRSPRLHRHRRPGQPEGHPGRRPRAGGGHAREGGPVSTSHDLRIGQGFDVHRFADDRGRPLVLGGVPVTGPGARGLEGHSDADALAHALCDAVLGAAGLGDLGRHAPDTDPAWKDADSLRLLARMVTLVRGAGWVPVNADCTVVAEAPRLAPFTDRMGERLGEVLGAPVQVKATRAEGLGALGRGEGIAATAVVLLGRAATGAGDEG